MDYILTENQLNLIVEEEKKTTDFIEKMLNQYYYEPLFHSSKNPYNEEYISFFYPAKTKEYPPINYVEYKGIDKPLTDPGIFETLGLEKELREYLEKKVKEHVEKLKNQ